MSFSEDTKRELYNITKSERCCNLSELSAIWRSLKKEDKTLRTDNAQLAARVQSLVFMVFKKEITIDVVGDLKTYELELDSETENALISAKINKECCKSAFTRGVFLASGTVTDPKKGYHIEFSSKNSDVIFDLYDILFESSFMPKLTCRKETQVLYFKSGSEITDILTLIGAQNAMMNVWETRIEKNIKNSINRSSNFESANEDKVIDASAKQRDAIKSLFERNIELSGEMSELAKLRMANPDLSMKDLGGLMKPPLTKSAVARRLNKLIEMAEKK